LAAGATGASLPRVRLPVALLLVAAAAGCGGSPGDDRPRPEPAAVSGRLDLDRPRAGAPDAGTAAGHGNDGGVGVTGSATFAFTGRVSPPGSRVRVSGARSAVVVERSGRFSVAVDGLEPGPNAIRVAASRAGARPWSADVRVVRGEPARVEVPRRDTVAPVAALRVRPAGGGAPVLSVSPSAAGERRQTLRLAEPRFTATAIARDDGGTGRIRLSTSYVTRCGAATRRTTRYLPPAQIAGVAIPPGARAPVERIRTATIELRPGAGCGVTGEVWAEATDAHGLQAVTRHVAFRYP
jgi:hypothetical protein